MADNVNVRLCHKLGITNIFLMLNEQKKIFFVK